MPLGFPPGQGSARGLPCIGRRRHEWREAAAEKVKKESEEGECGPAGPGRSWLPGGMVRATRACMRVSVPRWPTARRRKNNPATARSPIDGPAGGGDAQHRPSSHTCFVRGASPQLPLPSLGPPLQARSDCRVEACRWGNPSCRVPAYLPDPHHTLACAAARTVQTRPGAWAYPRPPPYHRAALTRRAAGCIDGVPRKLAAERCHCGTCSRRQSGHASHLPGQAQVSAHVFAPAWPGACGIELHGGPPVREGHRQRGCKGWAGLAAVRQGAPGSEAA